MTTIEQMITDFDADEPSPIHVLEGALLRSFREGDGNWRFYFSGLELTVRGNVSLRWKGSVFGAEDPLVYSELRRFPDCEVLNADLVPGALVLDFWGDTITIATPDDGADSQDISLRRDGERIADLWSREGDGWTHSRGARAPFDSLV
jgi:hypothetical protein